MGTGEKRLTLSPPPHLGWFLKFYLVWVRKFPLSMIHKYFLDTPYSNTFSTNKNLIYSVKLLNMESFKVRPFFRKPV